MSAPILSLRAEIWRCMFPGRFGQMVARRMQQRTSIFDGNQHVGGVPWHQAPVPPRWHRCRVQTFGWIDLDFYERCACGSIARNLGAWREKNSRKPRT